MFTGMKRILTIPIPFIKPMTKVTLQKLLKTDRKTGRVDRAVIKMPRSSVMLLHSNYLVGNFSRKYTMFTCKSVSNWMLGDIFQQCQNFSYKILYSLHPEIFS